MPIDPIVLQRRHAEVGRIRLGQKGDRGQPQRLDRFRFTSPSRDLIAGVAELYGGEPKPWRNGTLDEYEVITDATSLPVNVLKGGMSQWFELWTAGGCKHRCTGVDNHTDPANVQPCDPNDRDHIAALDKPTTRLSLALTELDSLGGWRLETKGWNAAAELPNMAELAAHVGDLVPARLTLVQRRAIRQTQDGPKTSIFVMPSLDLLVSKARLVALASGGGQAAPAIEAAPAQQIEAAPAPPVDYTAQIAACSTVDEVSALWRRIVAEGHLYPPVRAALEDRGRALTPAAPPVDGEAPVDADVADDGDPDVEAALTALVTAAGRAGMNLPALQARFESDYDKKLSDATVDELNALRESLA